MHLLMKGAYYTVYSKQFLYISYHSCKHGWRFSFGGRALWAELYVIPRKETRLSVAHALVPPVLVLLQHVDNGALFERELILSISDVLVHSNNWRERDEKVMEELLLDIVSNTL